MLKRSSLAGVKSHLLSASFPVLAQDPQSVEIPLLGGALSQKLLVKVNPIMISSVGANTKNILPT